jgi:hypothetical protein
MKLGSGTGMGSETWERSKVSEEVVSERRGRRDTRTKTIELQTRDFEILLFLNEMGPLDGVLLGLKFFAWACPQRS